jgi:ABC-type uncharacterized transport system permease subunit
MVSFLTQNPSSGILRRTVEWKMLLNIPVIWHILQAFGYILWAFGYVVVIWYIFTRFGILYQEKSGNPGSN